MARSSPSSLLHLIYHLHLLCVTSSIISIFSASPHLSSPSSLLRLVYHLHLLCFTSSIISIFSASPHLSSPSSLLRLIYHLHLLCFTSSIISIFSASPHLSSPSSLLRLIYNVVNVGAFCDFFVCHSLHPKYSQDSSEALSRLFIFLFALHVCEVHSSIEQTLDLYFFQNSKQQLG